MEVRNTIGIKMDTTKIRLDIIKAGEIAIRQLIKVAKQEITGLDPEDELAADKLKNAAASKKLAIFDALEITARIELERTKIEEAEGRTPTTKEKKDGGGFAEKNSR